MDFESLYHFLFETYAGIGLLIAACLIVSIIASAVMEVKTFSKLRVNPEDEIRNFNDTNADTKP